MLTIELLEQMMREHQVMLDVRARCDGDEWPKVVNALCWLITKIQEKQECT